MPDKATDKGKRITTIVIPSGDHLEKAQRPGERPVAPATEKPAAPPPAKAPKSDKK